MEGGEEERRKESEGEEGGAAVVVCTTLSDHKYYPSHLLITSLSLTEAQLVPLFNTKHANTCSTVLGVWERDWYNYRLSETTSGVFKMDVKTVLCFLYCCCSHLGCLVV